MLILNWYRQGEIYLANIIKHDFQALRRLKTLRVLFWSLKLLKPKSYTERDHESQSGGIIHNACAY